MIVSWNKGQAGFQNCWLWQFGPGPFQVVARHPVPPEPRILGWPGQKESAEIQFEPGQWYTIALPPKHHFNEHGITTVTFFHEKWFVPTIL